MQVQSSDLKGAALFTVTGRIDATTAGQLESALLSGAGQAQGAVLVDLSAVEYISSAGLRTMLKLAKLCQKQKLPLRLTGLQPAVYEVFKVSGFAGIIKIAPTLDEAVSSLKE